MLTTDQINKFEREGFVLGGQVLSDSEVDELRSEMERVINDRDNADAVQPVLLRNMGKDGAPVWQIVNIWQASDAFKGLMFNPAITGYIGTLTGANSIRIWHDQIQYKPAAVGGVNMWHQDAPYWPVLKPMNQVTAWVALDDVDLENGCMSMVPGSHRWGNKVDFLHTLKSFDAMPDEFEGHILEVKACPVKKGVVHFHHALTWHGSSANVSGRPRRAIALHFMTDEARFVADQNHVMKPFMHMADNEPIDGDAFPVVWSR